MSWALSQDNAMVQQWPGIGSRDCQGLNMHNFLNNCLNGASGQSIIIYVDDDEVVACMHQRSYAILKLLGAPSPSG